MAINPDQGETVGWPRFVHTMAAAWRQIPPAERAAHGDLHRQLRRGGRDRPARATAGLPRAYSGHNGFSEWGMPPPRDTHALVLGYDGPADATPQFIHCRVMATINNGIALQNNEQGIPVMLCVPSRGWAALWSQLTHYD